MEREREIYTNIVYKCMLPHTSIYAYIYIYIYIIVVD